VAVEPAPAVLVAVDQLKTIASAVLFERQPFERTCDGARSRDVDEPAIGDGDARWYSG
jgi:hypothetical protein